MVGKILCVALLCFVLVQADPLRRRERRSPSDDESKTGHPRSSASHDVSTENARLNKFNEKRVRLTVSKEVKLDLPSVPEQRHEEEVANIVGSTTTIPVQMRLNKRRHLRRYPSFLRVFIEDQSTTNPANAKHIEQATVIADYEVPYIVEV